jgi:thiosulfate reductase cytochrome b subunit
MSTPRTSPLQPAWLRATHWINAACLLLMLASGWRVYNAAPLYSFRFPKLVTLGGWLGGALQWHFAVMWLLVINGLAYLAVNGFSGRFRRGVRNLRWCAIVAELRLAYSGTLAHDQGRYNAIQLFAYVSAVAALVLLVVSGLVLWKSVQFPVLRELLGGYEAARRVHFLAMAFVCVFLVGHVIMAALFPQTIVRMLRGR